MARRAAILGDTGPAAPECWDGYLGSRQVHGVLWWLFSRYAENCIGNPQDLAEEFRGLVARAGTIVLHHEVGQGNLRQDNSGECDSIEHFGFRDGLSQPWVELGKGAPAPGGGTPRADGSWAPLAPGEFLLGYPDEDGLVQPWPCNGALRRSGTYMAFRKLEQDVVGFRAFLRADGRGEQEATRLAANVIGRWPDGSPLVRSPRNAAHERHVALNDFRYQQEDPPGRRCPIGAHIRRTNPRDTGNRDEVRRHRLLRRGISYGGAPLPENSAGDGVKRGLLFVALNARIDQQFEFVQARWANGGEFLGQVGASRDPLLAAHGGEAANSCALPPRPAPVTNLTRFVTMRGGDYFFVPGMRALTGLADGSPFPPEYQGIRPEDAIGSFETLDPLDLARIAEAQLLQPDAPDLLMEIQTRPQRPGVRDRDRDRDFRMAFVARHARVRQILQDDEAFTVVPYAEQVGQMLGHEQLLISLPRQNPDRGTRIKILEAARQRLDDHLTQTCGQHLPEAAAAHTASVVASILGRFRRRGTLDIVGDLGRVVPIALAERLFGISGPNWASPTGAAALLGRSGIENVPPSWLATLPTLSGDAKALFSMQTWTRLAFLQVFINTVNDSGLAGLARQAAAELMRHIDQLIARARSLPRSDETLLRCLVALGDQPEQFGMERRDYDEHMRLILAEMTVGGVETANKALANLVDFALDRPDIMAELRAAAIGPNDARIDALVREGLRFAPVSPLLFRMTARDTRIGAQSIPAGTTVCLLVEAALKDPQAFPEPGRFDPDRPAEPYLHFGDTQSGTALHRCRGENLAVVELRELVKAVFSLDGLRRAAGRAGERQDEQLLPTSLTVRFDPT